MTPPIVSPYKKKFNTVEMGADGVTLYVVVMVMDEVDKKKKKVWMPVNDCRQIRSRIGGPMVYTPKV